MQTAILWAQRAMCSQPNRRCGAVITDSSMRRVLSIGYNGPAKGLPDNFCSSWCEHRKSLNPPLPPEELSRCPCLHAEDNAIALLTSDKPDKVMFVTMQPCIICAQRIVNAGVARVYYMDSYRDDAGLDILQRCGVGVERLQMLVLPDLAQVWRENNPGAGRIPR